jgi:hypothetical protein
MISPAQRARFSPLSPGDPPAGLDQKIYMASPCGEASSTITRVRCQAGDDSSPGLRAQ